MKTLNKVIKIYIPGEEDTVVDSVFLDDGQVLYLKKKKPVTIPSKKNQKTALKSKSTGKMFIKHSPQFLKWKKKMAPFWDEQYLKLYDLGYSLPITRCKINIRFYFATDVSRDTQNKWETVADALFDHKIIAQDNVQVISETLHKGFVCKHRPRTELYITIITPEDSDFDYDITDYEKLSERKRQELKDRYEFNKIKKSLSGK